MDKNGFLTKYHAILFSREGIIALLSILSILIYLVLRYLLDLKFYLFGFRIYDIPLLIIIISGGGILVSDLLIKVTKFEFSSDLLAGISILTAILLQQYLAGVLVILMLSGGTSLESYAVHSASSVLQALANRMPSVAHRKLDGSIEDVSLNVIDVGDILVVFPHEICPVDGTVIEGWGSMDESYLTGEPYNLSKAPGAAVLSGAINGEKSLTIRTDRLPVDSRYTKIMQVMRESEQKRPKIRRLGDQLGSYYTPFALFIAILAWIISAESIRFLAVLVVATPCPLLIAIPISIIGSVSLAASRGIIIKDPTVLERIKKCKKAMFDKTGTLTYGKPAVTDISTSPSFDKDYILSLVASLEIYSRHPLSKAIIDKARENGVPMYTAEEINEKPGKGLTGIIKGKRVQITSRKHIASEKPGLLGKLPSIESGMECIILADDDYAATIRLRDEPRPEGLRFIKHLEKQHGFTSVMLVSGDRESEVRFLADKVGITEVYSNQSPEQKLELVRENTASSETLFVGDGINDAPALTAATVGVAFGQSSDVITEAAGAVILDSSLQRVDELMHIGSHMRSIALQSAVGGIALSIIAMFFAATGYLSPVAGAIIQEVIDVVAVTNALRVAIKPRVMTDY